MQRFCKHNTVELMNSAFLTMDLLQMSLQVLGLHVRGSGGYCFAGCGHVLMPFAPLMSWLSCAFSKERVDGIINALNFNVALEL